MRRPRPEDFDPHHKPAAVELRPDVIDVTGVAPLRPRSQEQAKGVFRQEQNSEPDKGDIVVSRHHDTTIPRDRDATIPQPPEILEMVRKAVKELGKEAATHRFTAEEKQAVAGIIFAYRQQGMKTSENEIARIAINYAVEDFKRNGDQSVLAQVLKKLNA